MKEIIELGEISITVIQKNIKNVHLAVYPPDGRVTLSIPSNTRLDVARVYAISKLEWIRNQQKRLKCQARETPRQFIDRESHNVWGRRYLMTVEYKNSKPSVVLSNNRIFLIVRPGSSKKKRSEIMHEWHKSLLHKAVPPLIRKWEKIFNVDVSRYFLQRMKTKWGSCNHTLKNIRLNTELIKKPKDLLDYVIAHEVAHLIEPTHNDRYIAILEKHYFNWREARAELNELPLGAEVWKE